MGYAKYEFCKPTNASIEKGERGGALLESTNIRHMHPHECSFFQHQYQNCISEWSLHLITKRVCIYVRSLIHLFTDLMTRSLLLTLRKHWTSSVPLTPTPSFLTSWHHLHRQALPLPPHNKDTVLYASGILTPPFLLTPTPFSPPPFHPSPLLPLPAPTLSFATRPPKLSHPLFR